MKEFTFTSVEIQHLVDSLSERLYVLISHDPDSLDMNEGDYYRLIRSLQLLRYKILHTL